MPLYLCPAQIMINDIAVGKKGYGDKGGRNYIEIQEFYFQHQSICNFVAFYVTGSIEDFPALPGKGVPRSK